MKKAPNFQQNGTFFLLEDNGRFLGWGSFEYPFLESLRSCLKQPSERLVEPHQHVMVADQLHERTLGNHWIGSSTSKENYDNIDLRDFFAYPSQVLFLAGREFFSNSKTFSADAFRSFTICEAKLYNCVKLFLYKPLSAWLPKMAMS